MVDIPESSSRRRGTQARLLKRFLGGVWAANIKAARLLKYSDFLRLRISNSNRFSLENS